jgi:hypothetical protein
MQLWVVGLTNTNFRERNNFRLYDEEYPSGFDIAAGEADHQRKY